MKTSFVRRISIICLLPAFVIVWLAGCSGPKYENPIANNSQQPDKILFDKSTKDIEKKRYEMARLTLQTLLNTYPDSEYIAKAKLAIADSWYREGTRHALAQAEAEYKDFITFFPTMEEAAESQLRVCDIHVNQMQKPDRDNTHAVKADHECRNLLLQFPNSRFIENTEQRLREVQEVIAEAEFRVGSFYSTKGAYRAGINRLQTLTDHYPLYSRNDEALWLLGTIYERLGEQFEEKTAETFSKLIRDYPLSPRADEAKLKLAALNRPIPEPDPEMYELMKYNVERQIEKGKLGKFKGLFGGRPDVRMAAKRGRPAMTPLKPATPPGIRPSTGLGRVSGAPSAEVTAETISGPSKLDTEPDARKGRAEKPPEEGK